MLEDAKVIRKFPEAPLTGLPELSPSIPDFVPTAKLTQETINNININPDGFLWPEEEKLFLHILKLNKKCVAFDDNDYGILCDDYFSLYIMLVVEHAAWKLQNIPIPLGLRDQLIKMIVLLVYCSIITTPCSPLFIVYIVHLRSIITWHSNEEDNYLDVLVYKALG